MGIWPGFGIANAFYAILVPALIIGIIVQSYLFDGTRIDVKKEFTQAIKILSERH